MSGGNRCEVCSQRAAGYVAGIHVCPKHRAVLLRRGTAWVAHAEVEWAWVNGHGVDPRRFA